MGISTSTVRVLIFRACRKLKVASRARLIEALSPRLRQARKPETDLHQCRNKQDGRANGVGDWPCRHER
jgi:hypothetical protein